MEQIVLQVSLKDDDTVEIKLGSKDFNPLTLVGILEQVQLSLLNDLNVESEDKKFFSQQYDA